LEKRGKAGKGILKKQIQHHIRAELTKEAQFAFPCFIKENIRKKE